MFWKISKTLTTPARLDSPNSRPTISGPGGKAPLRKPQARLRTCKRQALACGAFDHRFPAESANPAAFESAPRRRKFFCSWNSRSLPSPSSADPHLVPLCILFACWPPTTLGFQREPGDRKSRSHVFLGCNFFHRARARWMATTRKYSSRSPIRAARIEVNLALGEFLEFDHLNTLLEQRLRVRSVDRFEATLGGRQGFVGKSQIFIDSPRI